MSRLFATFSHLVLGFSLVLTGSGCSCGTSGTLGADDGSTPASVHTESGVDDGCCDGPSDGADRDSEGDCCDGGDCTVVDRSEQVGPMAQLRVPNPTDEVPAAPTTAPDAPVGRGFDARHFLDAFSPLHRASDPPRETRSAGPARYLALQVFRV
jgi:hypothetical protein